MAVAASALSAARRERASLLVSVASGMLDVKDAIEMAAADERRYLLKIRLRQLLLAQEGWGPTQAERVIYRTAEIVGTDMSDRREMLGLRLSWLLDPRTGGDRFAAFHDALLSERDRHTPPWPGFPYSPRPEGATFAAIEEAPAL